MTGFELDNFYDADDQRYILNNNREFKDWLYEMKCNYNLNSLINLQLMQDLINEIVMFYEFKYPDKMLYSLKHCFNEYELENTIKISKVLDFEQLKFRLYHDYVQFLECNYWNHIILKREKKKLWDIPFEYIRVSSDGKIEPVDLLQLEEGRFLSDISGISRIEDLYGRFASIDTDVDYSELTRCINQHKFNVTVRNKILNVIPFALIYSKSTLPENGYIRAKSYIRTFNREYNLNMTMDELDEIMNKDYSKSEKCLIKKK